MTVGIYIRVSTEEQAKEGFSISAQRESLKSYCYSQGWHDFKYYVDEGKSAKDMHRPILQKMIQHIQEGMLDKVLVWRLDRMTRSVRDLHEMLETFEKHNCAFVSATEPYDTSTAVGRLFITLVAAMAQWERENTGERVSMVLMEKARTGEFLSQAPFGFKKINKRLVVDDEQIDILKDIISKVKSGYSIRQVSNYLNESGLTPIRGYQWHITSILEMLKNPALYGSTRWKDEIIENTHQGIMSKEEHEHLLKILSSRQNKKKRAVNSFFIYQMKLICPTCGNHLTSERYKYERKDGSIYQHNRYRCQVCALAKRKPISVSETVIEDAFVDYMKEFPKKIQKIKEQKKENPTGHIKSQIARVEKQRAKYQRAWANDQMTDDEFSERMLETKQLLDDWKEQLEEIEPTTNNINETVLLEIVNDFNLNWTSLNPKEKHQFLNMFIEGIKFVKEDKLVTVVHVLFY
ncbi:recombinase family protein [Ornithinibacillus xuwenensis]|uniref:Recombinase family protein n=1 Tax=Ornithinibacillus xuwenensis TaxID=3144668 RepID=A0ABU9XBT9_9BACI